MGIEPTTIDSQSIVLPVTPRPTLKNNNNGSFSQALKLWRNLWFHGILGVWGSERASNPSEDAPGWIFWGGKVF